MIKKIIDPSEFSIVVDQIYNRFKKIEENQGHNWLRFSPKSIKNNYASGVLKNSVHVWANQSEDGYNAAIGFNTVYDPRFDEYYLAEFIWLSDSPTVSFRLLKTSEEWAKKNDYKYIVMSLVDKMPKKDSLSKAYQRMGFVKESEQYIKKLGD